MTKPNADTLAAAAKAAAAKGPPPVHLWNPPFCGDIDMRIARDGTWFYLGTPIGRAPLVKLFSSILRREGDAYFLVTPVEKVGIRVDDAPFVAVRVDRTGTGASQVLQFTTNVGDTVVADAANPLRVDTRAADHEPRPYVRIRGRLEALVARSVFYELVDMAEERETSRGRELGVMSAAQYFPLGLAEP